MPWWHVRHSEVAGPAPGLRVWAPAEQAIAPRRTATPPEGKDVMGHLDMHDSEDCGKFTGASAANSDAERTSSEPGAHMNNAGWRRTIDRNAARL